MFVGKLLQPGPPSYLFITGPGTYATNPLLNVCIRKIKIALPLDPQVWHCPMSKLDENRFYSKFCRVMGPFFSPPNVQEFSLKVVSPSWT